MKVNALSSLKAKSLPKGKYADGRGLWLWKSTKDRGSWVLRVVVPRKRRELGLGRWPEVAISEARERAAAIRKQVRDGLDPVVEKQRAKQRSHAMTVREAVESCFAAKQAELKNDEKSGRWLSPLKIHVLPTIGSMPIESMNQHTMVKVLEPLWHTKSDTARKALNRINFTLEHAAAFGLDVDLQAVLKAKALLGKRRHVARHIPSLPYKELPAFYKVLCAEPHLSCLALRFLILTACRSGEVRLATHDELDGNLWIIPADRTKTNKEHRVPLSKEALRVIKAAKVSAEQSFLFPSQTNKPLSDATLSKFMKDRGYKARPHGFRAIFRTWAEEEANAEYEVKETVLGHAVDTGVVGAYQRSDRLKKRRTLLNKWANYVTS